MGVRLKLGYRRYGNNDFYLRVVHQDEELRCTGGNAINLLKSRDNLYIKSQQHPAFYSVTSAQLWVRGYETLEDNIEFCVNSKHINMIASGVAELNGRKNVCDTESATGFIF